MVGVSNLEYEASEETGQIVVSAQLESARYRTTWAHVRVFLGKAYDPAKPDRKDDDRHLIVDEIIRE